ncbi:exodeoxyribonuclease VII small subunit [Loigolactobacillus coryniformis]|mgnify:CR=1 FL=1|jgi:exodeoxyribonuclease VII small subunit|uniref:Exodeoxyribonuclease 7 small subunit n=3 Tax=Loigolactobacillus coryniformis TaxID=1610 RepID=A0A0R1FHF0_9LACO|nr:exodeoxyribonuclease VII small subunit [Loigolactobacillus coryniformis]MDT3390929.1 exodeoxyribonuclease VII small subunit [Bacillota bacterium]OEH90424.1 exodeoxyribonuclease VII small subunit [Loigolactobacillus coryniformis subsp. coryniformis]RRG05855.1 MAG: exodeoxyribonuclease VII small subunit [Lactobacillus sp.]ATO43994.1 exodeoxyribonuclease VII small subunit [Loigolactobacillus coryniformis subsp. torquens DSM 20004 = KCTC 3535]ATO55668.1 exodeoxyribonuclease VII small subunit [L
MAEPTFEQNLEALNTIVTNLEQGDIPLEQALTEFQKGVTLSKTLQDTLTHAEKTLTKMMAENGTEVPFEEKGTDADD